MFLFHFQSENAVPVKQLLPSVSIWPIALVPVKTGQGVSHQAVGKRK
jgi:hypothetical protein